VPAHQGVHFEDGECLETAGPNTVEPDPKQAFATAETQPLAVFVGDHCQLLTQSEDLQVEGGPVSEQTRQGGKQGEENCFHPLDATVPHPEKSIESISTM
jgi:hypothetical protein